MIPSATDPIGLNAMRDYIEKSCGISIPPEKDYLLESRLTVFMAEQDCADLSTLHRKAVSDTSFALRDRIVDLMTTNETLWFRDQTPFQILREVVFPAWMDELRNGKRESMRIWCCASSTGQEPYSIAMTALEFALVNPSFRVDKLKIIATDISASALFMAKTGRYDALSIGRGLTESLRDKWFEPAGKVWSLKSEVKALVEFRKMNLQDDFKGLGIQDAIFCRNVLIYFAQDFKQSLLRRIAAQLPPDGLFFVGASEPLLGHNDIFESHRYDKGFYFRARRTEGGGR